MHIQARIGNCSVEVEFSQAFFDDSSEKESMEELIREVKEQVIELHKQYLEKE